MLNKIIQYQVRKSFIALCWVIITIFLFLVGIIFLTYLFGGQLTSLPQFELADWIYFVVFGIGIADIAKYFRTMNQLGVTRRQQALGYLLHGLILVGVITCVLTILGWLMPVINLKIMELKLPYMPLKHMGDSLVYIWKTLSGLFAALMVGACLGLFINKFNQKIGIWMGIGLMTALTVLPQLSFFMLHSIIAKSSSPLGQWLDQALQFAAKVPAQAYQALIVLILIGLYWLLQRRHVSKA